MRQDNGAVLSSAGCSYYEDLRKVGMTYYFLGAAHRGRGYALEAARLYRSLLVPLCSPRLIAAVRQGGAVSRLAAERAGFLLSEVRPCRDLNDDAALHVAFTRRIEKALYDGLK